MSTQFRRTLAPGIEMRQFEPRDAEAVYAVVDRNREHLRQWLPWVDHSHSPADIRQFIVRVQAQFEAGEGPNAGVWVDGVFAGNVGCHPINWANRNCSLGYWIAAAQAGQGGDHALLRRDAGLPLRGVGPPSRGNPVRDRQHAKLRDSQAPGLHAGRIAPRGRVGERPMGGPGGLGNDRGRVAGRSRSTSYLPSTMIKPSLKPPP